MAAVQHQWSEQADGDRLSWWQGMFRTHGLMDPKRAGIAGPGAPRCDNVEAPPLATLGINTWIVAVSN